MSTHKYIDRICCVAIAFALVVTIFFMNASAFGIQEASRTKGYETRLFDTSTVHTIDIVMDDWDGFLEGCTDEEYVLCSVVIDQETYKNVGIRAKGNTSLTQVASYGNDRYSFKIEFDHYDSTLSYYGLDKLSLNNIIQDNTYMKDYLTYQMMSYFGVDTPLCSYVYITVNGEDWGLYLAVEGVEEAFLERNYGSDYGELYKPDSISMGGGRGNGGKFDMDEWQAAESQEQSEEEQQDGSFPDMGDGDFPDMGDGDFPDMGDGNFPDMGDGGFPDTENWDVSELPEDFQFSFGGGFGGMMGSSDVSLIYSDDEYSSYQNIFDSAKTDITDADKDRLIDSLRQLNQQENLEEVVDIDEVIRYFVVHNFVCNFDSYTGMMIHNYYLYEEDGQLSMIPWDYNLAFGGFESSASAESLVNYPIDTPVSGGSVDSRPMLAWIFSSEEYTELYHQYFAEFISEYFDSGYFEKMMEEVYQLISPYVEKDPTKFCSYEEFETGFETLREFCLLRAESVSGQISGEIPSTSEGQQEASDTLVDASGILISDMGSMNGMGGGMGGPGGMELPEGMEQPAGDAGGMELPEGMEPPTGDTGGMELPEGMKLPAGDAGGMGFPNGIEAQEVSDEEASSETEEPSQQTEPAEGQEPSGRPDNGFQRGDRMTQDGFPGAGDSPAGESGQDMDSWIWLGISAAVLAAGLLAAALYRKRS